MRGQGPFRLVPVAAAALCAGCFSWPRLSEPDPDVETRIRCYEELLAAHPLLYPVHAGLGRAWLDRARETHDPKDLARARAALHRSIELQPNADAFQGLAAVENFAHRFDRALDWGCLAACAMPWDRTVTATIVESHLGLGEVTEAAALVERRAGEPPSFQIEEARGLVQAAQGRAEEAAAAFLRAATLAHAQGLGTAAFRAELRAADLWLDAHRPERAEPLLQAAGRRAPSNQLLWIRAAEWMDTRSEWDVALSCYGLLLCEGGGGPELNARAFRLARLLRDESAARLHFNNVENWARRTLELGEVYPLETLATLYADAGVRTDEARRLARQNLLFKRDASAWELARRLGVAQ